MRILFTGGSSLLAQAWIKINNSKDTFVLGQHKREIVSNKHEVVQLAYSEPSILKEQIKSLNIDVIINCIGLTNVESCEKNSKEANFLNIQLPSLISSIASDLNLKFVHISTDQLYEGDTPYYNEEAPVAPLNIYAKTKYEGEKQILKSNSKALVVRTNFFGFGPNYKPSFSDYILNNLKKGKISNLFEDVFFTPISVKTLSQQIGLLLANNKSGIYNISSNERISKYHFGLTIAKFSGYSSQLIQPISIESLPELVLRPKDMSLSNHKYTGTLNIKLPSIDIQVEEMLNSQEEISEKRIIPYGRQNVSEKDIKSVLNVLKSDFLTQGPIVHQFEKRVSEYCGAKHAVACNSATSALHIACLSLGVGKGDLVWTSPISFVASSNCALYCNADVDFVDIDSVTYNMSVEALEQKLVHAKQNNRLPKVVIPVHLAGQSCEMEEIHDLSKKYGFKIIEDASHAIGGTYKGKPVGNCEYSDIAVFSFHPVKIITTCEGGMCLTNDPVIANLLNRYHSHGISRQASEMTKAPDGPWYYEQLNLGLNYRMNEVQAALGLSQMDRLDEFVAERRVLAQNYNKLFEEYNVQIPNQHKDTNSSWHLYIIRIKKNNKLNHKQVFEKLRSAGILVNLHYIPIYRQPYYQKLGFNKQGFEESEKYYEEAISIPIFPGLTNDEQRKVISLIDQPIGFQNLF